jgi:acetyl esterase/lipase
MSFFRDRHLPQVKDRSIENWKASPVHAPPETLALAQKFHTYIAAMGVDILLEESRVFAERLKEQRSGVTLHEFPNYPHEALAVQGVLGPTLLIKAMGWMDQIWSGESPEEGFLEMRV